MTSSPSEPGQPAAAAPTRLTRWLEAQPGLVFSAYAIFAAFCTYFCMYAFRKPFAAASFAGTSDALGFEVGLKILYVVSQVIGYTMSKFLGIKVVAEASPNQRAKAILGLIGAAWIALLAFALLPPPWGFIAMFFNGVPLGMVWGLVFGFLEGRRMTEVLGAGLSAAYIVGSGAVKGVGLIVLGWGIPEYWMPFAVGALFTPLLLAFVWLLKQLPPPSAVDEDLRVRREPMDASARNAFVRRFSIGLLLLIVGRLVMTAYRDFRDNFSADILKELGHTTDTAEIIASTEVWVAFGVLAVLGALFVIRDNRRAFLTVHGVMILGSVCIGVATLLFHRGQVDAVAWLTLCGLGLYACYVPYDSVLFDRLIAASGSVANAGFLMYLTDAFGYLGSVGVTLYKNFGHPDLSWVAFFTQFSYVMAIGCAAVFVLSVIYFAARLRTRE